MTVLADPFVKLAQRASVNPAPVRSINMDTVATLILGGGQGTRLFPLTYTRCKPAICFGGKFLLVDVALSNALNSTCRMIYVITQFLSTSLHKHISRNYQNKNASHSSFVDILTAEQKPTTTRWYQGTADAVRQNLRYLQETPAEYFLILSGDQLYHMDFRHMVAHAQTHNADVTIASLPVNKQDATRMGLLKINESTVVTDFYEKPKEEAILEQFRMPLSIRQHHALNGSEDRPYLGSMGIYLFKRQALLDLLEKDLREDFGKHLLPTKIGEGNVCAYLYNGYWEDIGTIRSFYDANIALTQSQAQFNYYQENWPIYSQNLELPPAKISHTRLDNAIICEGVISEAEEISQSILGPRTVVKKGTIIRSSYVMGHDFYNAPHSTCAYPAKLEIGEDCFLQNCILDKNCHIGKKVKLINRNQLQNLDGDGFCIRDGIIIVSQGASIPDGFSL